MDVKVAQHFLEHLDSNGELPLNFAKPQAPVTATVLGRTKLISDDAPGDIEHVIMKLPAGFHYVEGEKLSRINLIAKAANNDASTDAMTRIVEKVFIETNTHSPSFLMNILQDNLSASFPLV